MSDRPQTTRTQIRGVRTTPESQLVLLDTPGIHKPRTLLGERTNEPRALDARGGRRGVPLDRGDSAIGPGDRFVAGLVQQVETPKVLVVSKTDLASRAAVGEQLVAAVAELGEFDAYVPLSSADRRRRRRAAGRARGRACPKGREYYPGGVVTDQPETFLVAELVREKLLRVAREELPHSITVVAEELEPERDDDMLALRGEGARGARVAEGHGHRQGRRGDRRGFNFQTHQPTFTTVGNNAFEASAWVDAWDDGQLLGSFGPGAPGEQPHHADRNYSDPWSNPWQTSKCDPTVLVPGGNDILPAVTNLFAGHNRMHDFSYLLGFTETNYNAQLDNFGNTARARTRTAAKWIPSWATSRPARSTAVRRSTSRVATTPTS